MWAAHEPPVAVAVTTVDFLFLWFAHPAWVSHTVQGPDWIHTMMGKRQTGGQGCPEMSTASAKCPHSGHGHTLSLIVQASQFHSSLVPQVQPLAPLTMPLTMPRLRPSPCPAHAQPATQATSSPWTARWPASTARRTPTPATSSGRNRVKAASCSCSTRAACWKASRPTRL
eukprot:357650-Chlamydomonas_euryale.AAC.4